MRALGFNETVGADTIFVTFGQETHAFLNVVCWGTSLQITEYMPEKNAMNALKAIMDCWAVPFGPPLLLVVDQGTEFTGKQFSERLGQMGVFVHFTDTKSPWQASRTEKAGHLFKQKLELLMDTVSAQSWDEFLQCCKETCVARNRYFHRSGFSPYQRAFGYQPRMPASLTSDDALDPCLVAASATNDVQRAWDIRAAAAQAWLKSMDEETIKRSLKTPSRTSDLKPLDGGDWVYVWRDNAEFKGWSDPGVVLTTSPNGKSLWISLRGNLLKASREQVRPAVNEELLGIEIAKELSQELIQDMKQGKLTKFHDLTEDGNPDVLDMPTTAIEQLGQEVQHEVRDDSGLPDPPAREPIWNWMEMNHRQLVVKNYRPMLWSSPWSRKRPALT